jgi:type VI secretion system protein ImpK
VAYWSCAEILLLATQLPSAQLPSARELRQQIVALLDRMVASARSAGMADADIAEARYAIVAFVDEQILKSNWPARSEWMNEPLQLQLYGEYKAGEKFFSRMKALLRAGNRPLALEVYYLCLSLGFRGTYGGTGESAALAQLAESAREQLSQNGARSAISPNARASDRVSAERHSKLPLIAALAACAVLALIVVVGLQLSLASAREQVVDLVRAQGVSSPQ